MAKKKYQCIPTNILITGVLAAAPIPFIWAVVIGKTIENRTYPSVVCYEVPLMRSPIPYTRMTCKDTIMERYGK